MDSNFAQLDVIIIGGGPAGMSASRWCADLGMSSLLIEGGPKLGGQLHWIHNQINNYPGVSAKDGSAFFDIFAGSDLELASRSIVGVAVEDADLKNKRIRLADGRTFTAKAIIIATGVRRRKLGVPGEEEFVGKGILESGARSKKEVAGKTVAVIGGGDAALENAVILAEFAEKVYLVHRRDRFTARNEFIERATCKSNIEFLANYVVSAITGDDQVSAVDIIETGSVSRQTVRLNALLIRIGVQPNTEPFRNQLDLDDGGYVVVNQRRETDLSYVLAIGDVASPTAPTIAGAAGDGATAAKVIRLKFSKPADETTVGFIKSHKALVFSPSEA